MNQRSQTPPDAERFFQVIALGLLLSYVIGRFIHLLERSRTLHLRCRVLGVIRGYGLHYEVLDPNTFFTYFFTNLFTSELLYPTVICLVKYSTLAFYWRLFAKSIRVPVYILAGVTTLWGLAVVRITSMSSDPRGPADEMTSISSQFSSARQLKVSGTGS